MCVLAWGGYRQCVVLPWLDFRREVPDRVTSQVRNITKDNKSAISAVASTHPVPCAAVVRFVSKGYKLREIVPSPRGLICAISTEEKRMDCRMYVEAEVGKKVSAYAQ